MQWDRGEREEEESECWICLSSAEAGLYCLLHTAPAHSRVTARLNHRLLSQHHRGPPQHPPAKRTTRDRAHHAFSITKRGTQQISPRSLTLQFRHQLLNLNQIPPSTLSHPSQHSSLAPPYALVLGGSSHLPGQYMDRSSLFQLIQEQVSE